MLCTDDVKIEEGKNPVATIIKGMFGEKREQHFVKRTPCQLLSVVSVMPTFMSLSIPCIYLLKCLNLLYLVFIHFERLLDMSLF